MQNPSCIDLLLTNNSYVFQQATTVCSSISDCHKLVSTVLKTSIPKGNPRHIAYRYYKKFDSLRIFWKIVIPFFSKTGDRGSNIQLAQDNELLQDDLSLKMQFQI